MLKSLAIANYRSIRELVIPLGPLNLVTGPNGSGKSNLYRALRLLADAAQGGIVGVAAENTQVWVVCHASRLVAALKEIPACMTFALEKEFGQTQVANQSVFDAPPWHWPTR
jgi:predicted ATPase